MLNKLKDKVTANDAIISGSAMLYVPAAALIRFMIRILFVLSAIMINRSQCRLSATMLNMTLCRLSAVDSE